MHNVLFDGLLVKDGGNGGTPAYQTDSFTAYFEWEWTPDLVRWSSTQLDTAEGGKR